MCKTLRGGIRNCSEVIFKRFCKTSALYLKKITIGAYNIIEGSKVRLSNGGSAVQCYASGCTRVIFVEDEV